MVSTNTKYMLDVPPKSEKGKSDYTYALFLGLGFGIATTVLFNIFPMWFEQKGFTVFGFGGSAIVSGILALVAIFGFPISQIAERRSVYLSILISLLATVAISFGVYAAEGQALIVILLILFAACYALMSVSFLPLALTVVNDRNKVFGVGVFFAGFELPNGILEAVLVQMGLF